ncbi:hypothetical protein ACFV0L_41285 [Streptosporangium canum]|uniref:hypothetical protein n=1 Tax=Streptosporangium canum TaxID=324952 RepID=UPI0036A2A82C
MSRTAKATPEAEAMRRLNNIATFWNERLAAVSTEADLVRMCFDRAKAAAKRSQRGGNARAMHELAELLANWAAQQEDAEIRRHSA